MDSAAVVIGIDRTGGLTPLKAAASGAEDVARWLRGEGYQVTCLTDRPDPATGDARPVTRRMIFDAVAEHVNRSNVEKLVIYFAGHGYLRSPSEIWLLSGAPEDPGEAVDQTTSADMARSSNIRNVVFISDSCRSIPGGLLGQKVTGGTIFPNRTAGNVRTEVDHFFATRPGEAAIESQIPDWAEASGLFTRVLQASHLDPPRDKLVSRNRKEVVPSRWLRDVLPDRVDEEAQRKSLALTQRPEVRLETEQAFIAFARFTQLDPRDYAPFADPHDFDPHELNIGFANWHHEPRRRSPASMPRQWRDAPRKRVNKAAKLHQFADLVSAAASSADIASIAEHARTVRDLGPQESGVPDPAIPAWITIRGGGARRAATPGKPQQMLDPATDPTYVGIPLGEGSAACSVAIELADGAGAVVAALRGYVCQVTIVEGDVSDIGYIPFSGERADVYRYMHPKIDAIRAVASAAAARGLLHIERKDAKRLAEATRQYKMFDPSLGLIAAQAYAAAGLREQAESVRDYSRQDLDVDLFDIWLLAGAERDGPPHYPFCPMMTQSWSYLEARGVEIHPVLRSRGRHSGFWTTFSKGEIDRIIKLVEAGDLR